MKCCTFIGHKNSSIEIFDKLYKEIEKIIIDSGVEVFYVGTQGNFDKIVYRALVELEKNYNIKFFVVLSYLNIKKMTYIMIWKRLFILKPWKRLRYDMR